MYFRESNLAGIDAGFRIRRPLAPRISFRRTPSRAAGPSTFEPPTTMPDFSEKMARRRHFDSYEDGLGKRKSFFKKAVKAVAKVAVAPVAGAAKLVGVKHATTKILSAPKRTFKAIKKSPLLLLAPPALLLKSKQRKSLGKTLKKVAPYAIPGYAAVKVTKSIFKAGTKAFAKPKAATEEQPLPPPEEMTPTEIAPTPGEEVPAEGQADDQFYTQPESSGGGYEMEEAPSDGYDYSGGGEGQSYEAPAPSYEEAEPSYEEAEPSYYEEAPAEEEAAPAEEAPAEEPSYEESPEADTEPEGSDLSGLASLASIAVMGSRLGFLPAVTAAAASPMGQKVFKGIGKLFKKKKKSAPAPAPVAVAPAVAKAPAKKPLPKWAIPAAIGGGVLLLLLATSGGEKRSAITVIR